MPSIIEKTEAHCLRWYPVTDSSRVVVWMTRDFGRISTMIKGAQRPKSPFLGQYDLFYTCELLFYYKDHQQLHIARECCPLERRSNLRNDWRAAAAASCLSDLVFRLSHPHAPSRKLFNFLAEGLNTLQHEGVRPGSFLQRLLQLCRMQGVFPQVKACARCQKDMASTGNGSVFDLKRGAVICAGCRSQGHAETRAIPLSGATLTMLRAWIEPDSARISRNTKVSPAQAREMAAVLEQFIEFHLDVSARAVNYALDMINRRVA